MNNCSIDDRQDFVAGDLRVNEQPFLTSLHVLFMREHNRLGDLLTNDQTVFNLQTCDMMSLPRLLKYLEKEVLRLMC